MATFFRVLVRPRDAGAGASAAGVELIERRFRMPPLTPLSLLLLLDEDPPKSANDMPNTSWEGCDACFSKNDCVGAVAGVGVDRLGFPNGLTGFN
jgi:hypothetical protein